MSSRSAFSIGAREASTLVPWVCQQKSVFLTNFFSTSAGSFSQPFEISACLLRDRNPRRCERQRTLHSFKQATKSQSPAWSDAFARGTSSFRDLKAKPLKAYDAAVPQDRAGYASQVCEAQLPARSSTSFSNPCIRSTMRFCSARGGRGKAQIFRSDVPMRC